MRIVFKHAFTQGQYIFHLKVFRLTSGQYLGRVFLDRISLVSTEIFDNVEDAVSAGLLLLNSQANNEL